VKQRAAYEATPAMMTKRLVSKARITDGLRAASLLNTAKQRAANEAKNKTAAAPGPGTDVTTNRVATAAAPGPGTDATTASRVAELLLAEASAARTNAANGPVTAPADPPPPPPDPVRMNGQALAAKIDQGNLTAHMACLI
jgi:hypothetical protein